MVTNLAERRLSMPSPLGHILCGTFVYLIGTSRKKPSNLIMGTTLVASIVPDFDFLPGILMGEPGAFHHGISHSVGFAFLFGTLVFAFLRCFSAAISRLEPR
jgi:LexA-binding, inner membrane-associated putative hydrolase